MNWHVDFGTRDLDGRKSDTGSLGWYRKPSSYYAQRLGDEHVFWLYFVQNVCRMVGEKVC